MRVALSPIPPINGSFGRAPTFGILSSYPPTACGLATFTAALSDGLSSHGAEVRVVRVADGTGAPSPRVIGELHNGSPASVAATADLLEKARAQGYEFEILAKPVHPQDLLSRLRS